MSQYYTEEKNVRKGIDYVKWHCDMRLHVLSVGRRGRNDKLQSATWIQFGVTISHVVAVLMCAKE